MLSLARSWARFYLAILTPFWRHWMFGSGRLSSLEGYRASWSQISVPSGYFSSYYCSGNIAEISLHDYWTVNFQQVCFYIHFMHNLHIWHILHVHRPKEPWPSLSLGPSWWSVCDKAAAWTLLRPASYELQTKHWSLFRPNSMCSVLHSHSTA